MFKLSVEFKTFAELSSFVVKMGSDVSTAKVEAASAPTFAQPEVINSTTAAELTPAQKAAQTRAAKKAQASEAPAAIPATMAGPGHASFPNVPGIQQPAPMASAPVMQAPAPQPVAVPEVSAQRKQYNDACVALIEQMKGAGIPDSDLSTPVLMACQQVGIPAGTRITLMTDEQIVAFYPVFSSIVSQALASRQAPAQNFV